MKLIKLKFLNLAKTVKFFKNLIFLFVSEVSIEIHSYKANAKKMCVFVNFKQSPFTSNFFESIQHNYFLNELFNHSPEK